MQNYYKDMDGDGLGNEFENFSYCGYEDSTEECWLPADMEGEPTGEPAWCSYNEELGFDANDTIFCESNSIDCADVCDGLSLLDIADEGCCLVSELDDEGYCEELSINQDIIPDKFSIHNIYPNPFNPSTNIVYTLPEYSYVKVTVYDIRGRTVAILTNGFETAGYYTINWNASAFASGVYLVEMRSESFHQVRKVLHMK